jgi:hypothetical protein
MAADVLLIDPRIIKKLPLPGQTDAQYRYARNTGRRRAAIVPF